MAQQGWHSLDIGASRYRDRIGVGESDAQANLASSSRGVGVGEFRAVAASSRCALDAGRARLRGQARAGQTTPGSEALRARREGTSAPVCLTTRSSPLAPPGLPDFDHAARTDDSSHRAVRRVGRVGGARCRARAHTVRSARAARNAAARSRRRPARESRRGAVRSLALRATLLLEVGRGVHLRVSVVPLDASRSRTRRGARGWCCSTLPRSGSPHRTRSPRSSPPPRSRTQRAQREPHGTDQPVPLDATESSDATRAARAERLRRSGVPHGLRGRTKRGVAR